MSNPIPRDDSPLYVLNLEAERVDSTYDPVEGFRATVAIPLKTIDAPDRRPLLVQIRLPKAEVDAIYADETDKENLRGTFDSICVNRADRFVRAVLAGEEFPTVDFTAAGTPKVAHRERARVFTEMITAKRAELEAKHGGEWLRVMLESEFRAVYADGERKGYRYGSGEIRQHAEVGEWYLAQLAPRTEGLPKPGEALDARRFTLEPRS